jgi:threonine/homoserine/homoserine lactone efflux protein
MQSILFEAVILGIIGGLLPGPILTMVVTDTIARGLQKSWLTVVYAIIAEFTLVGLMFTVLAFVDIPEVVLLGINIAGIVLLTYIAFNVWQSATNPLGNSTGISLKTMFGLMFLNSMPYMFWLTVCLPLIDELGGFVSYPVVWFFLAFELGWCASNFGLAAASHVLRDSIVKNGKLAYVFRGAAILLLFFAGKILWGLM